MSFLASLLEVLLQDHAQQVAALRSIASSGDLQRAVDAHAQAAVDHLERGSSTPAPLLAPWLDASAAADLSRTGPVLHIAVSRGGATRDVGAVALWSGGEMRVGPYAAQLHGPGWHAWGAMCMDELHKLRAAPQVPGVPSMPCPAGMPSVATVVAGPDAHAAGGGGTAPAMHAAIVKRRTLPDGADPLAVLLGALPVPRAEDRAHMDHEFSPSRWSPRASSLTADGVVSDHCANLLAGACALAACDGHLAPTCSAASVAAGASPVWRPLHAGRSVPARPASSRRCLDTLVTTRPAGRGGAARRRSRAGGGAVHSWRLLDRARVRIACRTAALPQLAACACTLTNGRVKQRRVAVPDRLCAARACCAGGAEL